MIHNFSFVLDIKELYFELLLDFKNAVITYLIYCCEFIHSI